MIWLSIILATEAVFIAFAVATSPDYYRLRGVVVIINMIMITLFAPKLVEVWGVTTNLGNALYVAVMTGQAIMVANGKRNMALGTIPITLLVLSIVIITGTEIRYAPIIPGNEAAANAINFVLTFTIRTVSGSFLGFAMSQYVLVAIYERTGKLSVSIRAFLAQVAAQAVDSVIFFPLAFYHAGNPTWMQAMVAGFLVKSVMTFFLLPMLLIPLRRKPLSKVGETS